MLDALLIEVRKNGLAVSNLVEGTHGRWHCYLRKRKGNKLHGAGFAATPEDAIRSAILKGEVADAFGDVLG